MFDQNKLKENKKVIIILITITIVLFLVDFLISNKDDIFTKLGEDEISISKLVINEIMTSNEIRQLVGMKPSDDPKADELRNSNISQPEEEIQKEPELDDNNKEGGEIQNG